MLNTIGVLSSVSRLQKMQWNALWQPKTRLSAGIALPAASALKQARVAIIR